MKRLSILFILVALVCSFLSAQVTIEAEGSGKTVEEAKENARMNLAEKVFPGIVQSQTTVSVSDDTESYSSSYSSKSSYTIVGEFPGFDYSIVSSKKNNCVVKTQITGDATTLNFYSGKMDEEGESAESLYERYLEMDSSVSVTKRKEALQAVLNCYSLYGMYRNIIIKLGGTVSDEDILPKTYTVLSYELESLINEEENELLRKSSSESINLEVTQRLAELQKAREENKKAIEEASAQAKEQRTLKLQQKITEYTLSSVAENASLLDTADSLEIDSYKEYLEAVETAQKDLAEISQMYTKLIAEQTAQIEASYNEESEAITTRAYPSAHLDLNGKPTADAKKLRENELNELRKEKDEEKTQIIETINSSMQREIRKRYQYYRTVIEALEEKTFNIQSSSNDISVSAKYDGSSYRWILSFKVNKPMSVQIDGIRLSYEKMTGFVIPSEEDERLAFVGSDEYTDTVDAYNKMFNTGNYECTASFSASVTENGDVILVFKSFTLSFVDRTEVDISLTRKRSGGSLNFEDTEYLQFDWLVGDKSESSDTVVLEEEKEKSVTTKAKDPLKVSFSGGLKLFGMAFGKLFNENMERALDLGVEGRLRLSDFFVSASFDTSYWWSVVGLGSIKGIPLFGVSLGVGYRFLDFITVAVRASYSKDLGLLLLPILSLKVLQNGEMLYLDVSCGCYVNCRTGRVAFSVGMEAIMDLDFLVK